MKVFGILSLFAKQETSEESYAKACSRILDEAGVNTHDLLQEFRAHDKRAGFYTPGIEYPFISDEVGAEEGALEVA